MPMKILASLAGIAGIALQTASAENVREKLVAPVDCDDGFNSVQVTRHGEWTNQVTPQDDIYFKIDKYNLGTGETARSSTLSTSFSDTVLKAMKKINACAISPITRYVYCTVGVDNTLDDTNANNVAEMETWSYYLIRLDPREGEGVAFCASYDMPSTWHADVKTMMPDAADFDYIPANTTHEAHGVYYSSLYNTNPGNAPTFSFMWSITDPDALTCWEKPSGIPATTTNMNLMTDKAAIDAGVEIGGDFAVIRGDMAITVVGNAIYGVKVSDPKASGHTYRVTNPLVAGTAINSMWVSGGDSVYLMTDSTSTSTPSEIYKITMTQGTTDVVLDKVTMNFLPALGTAAAFNWKEGDGAYCHMVHCSCEFGTPFNKLCHIGKHDMCESCSPGHDLVDGNCDACLPGYHKDSDGSCVPNVCGCVNGIAESGDDGCDMHGKQNCASCEDGYTLTPTSLGGVGCAPNKCTCPHGTPMTGSDCSQNGAVECMTCTAGYHKQRKSCLKNTCHCQGGSVDDSSCLEHMTESCA